jgi:hypothetical protein
MRTRRPSPLILVITLVSFLALACGLQGTAEPAADPNAVALAVQLTMQASQASGEPPSGPPPETIPPATEAAPPATDTPTVPTPTVAHVTIPVNPGGTNSFMTDRSSATLAGERRSIGDNLDIGLLERPFTANVMDYQGYLDLNRGELSIGAPWIYVSFFLEGAPPAGSTAVYAVEVDIDIDGRGDYLILGAAPATADWTTNGVRILRDTNNDVGAAHPMAADPPSGGNGYDELVFDQGQGPDPDAAWIRLAPGSSTKVQVAFKYAAIGSPNTWIWGVWTDEGVNKPEWFDYNDHFTAAEAGSPTSGSSLYPIKALASVDNSCRWVVGFTPDGDEPGVCPVPPTPTPKPQGSISGIVYEGYTTTVTAQRISGAGVTLGVGACSSSGAGSTSTSSSGGYSFNGLAAGTYCVTVTSLPPATYGWAAVSGYSRTVTIGHDEAKTGVNFGFNRIIG